MKRTPLRRKGKRRFKTATVDPEYLAFIRQQRCLCYASDPMGCGYAVAPHHEPPGKRDDHRTVPLCLLHHTEGPHSRHGMGREQFEAFHKLTLDDEIAYYRRKYAAWRDVA